MKIRIHVLISGRVQGVFFRSETKSKAKNLDIKGWVKNLPDDRVEVVAEGEKDKIEELIQFLKKGTLASRVDNVDVKIGDFKDEFEDFDIIY
jgi:acylphosphatase